jgi:DNA end-binding protein Ku
MLGPNGEPLARKYYSEKTAKDLDAAELQRGYEITKGKFVIITDDELERLAPHKTRDIDLTKFVKKDSISPLYFERGYFLTPDSGAEKAYKLLAEAMAKDGQVGIATFVMRGKEHLVAIFSDHGILRAETMRFPDEILSPKELGLPKKKNVPPATVKKFEALIKRKSKATFSAGADEETTRLLKLVKKKRPKRSNVVQVSHEERGEDNVIDLMAVLKRSLRGASN